MSNRYRARIYARDTGIRSSPTFSVHYTVSLHLQGGGGGGEMAHSSPKDVLVWVHS